MSNERFKEVSVYLRNAREEAGLSQTEVAKRLGYQTSQFVSNWERGLAAPPAAILRRLSDLYAINAETLFKLILKDIERKMRKEFRAKGSA